MLNDFDHITILGYKSYSYSGKNQDGSSYSGTKRIVYIAVRVPDQFGDSVIGRECGECSVDESIYNIASSVKPDTVLRGIVAHEKDGKRTVLKLLRLFSDK